MTIYFSNTEKSFFDDGIHDVLPADAIEISQEDYQTLLRGIESGKVYDFSSTRPQLADRPGPTAEQILEGVTLQRDALLAKASQAMTPLLLALQLGDATESESASAKAWSTYVRALKSIDLSSQPIAWPAQPQ